MIIGLKGFDLRGGDDPVKFDVFRRRYLARLAVVTVALA